MIYLLGPCDSIVKVFQSHPSFSLQSSVKSASRRLRGFLHLNRSVEDMTISSLLSLTPEPTSLLERISARSGIFGLVEGERTAYRTFKMPAPTPSSPLLDLISEVRSFKRKTLAPLRTPYIEDLSRIFFISYL